MAIIDKPTGRKIKVSTMINIVLTLIIVLMIGFGWYYLRGKNPVDTVQSVVAGSLPKPKYLFTIYGPQQKPFRAPLSTYVASNKIYVADTDNSRVMIYDYNGRYLAQFGKKGNVPGSMVSPAAVMVLNNEIYVVDITQAIVIVYDMDGKYKRILGNLQFVKPVSIAYGNERFYILDTGSMGVNILDKNGKMIKFFGKQGDKPGEFYCPDGLEIRDNKLYVADSNNNRIQIFDLDGKFLEEWKGSDGKGAGGYSIPRGIAFDRQGNLYTAEMLNNSVSITDTKGINLSSFSYAEPPTDEIEDTMNVPTSVFIDSDNRLYVTEMGGSRILVYDLL